MKYTLISIYPSGYGYILTRPVSRYMAYKARHTHTDTPAQIAHNQKDGIAYKVIPVDVAINKACLIGREYL
jgi:hypothetical protein